LFGSEKARPSLQGFCAFDWRSHSDSVQRRRRRRQQQQQQQHLWHSASFSIFGIQNTELEIVLFSKRMPLSTPKKFQKMNSDHHHHKG
jgi:hypothetical protein